LLSDLEPYQFQKLELTNHGEISFGFSLRTFVIYIQQMQSMNLDGIIGSGVCKEHTLILTFIQFGCENPSFFFVEYKMLNMESKVFWKWKLGVWRGSETIIMC
jgi:hypothetical protein